MPRFLEIWENFFQAKSLELFFKLLPVVFVCLFDCPIAWYNSNQRGYLVSNENMHMYTKCLSDNYEN